MLNDKIWAKNQVVFANSFFTVGILIVFLTSLRVADFIDASLLIASTITLFYFWFGYLFLAIKDMESSKILEYFFDFLVLLVLVGLFFVIWSKSEIKAIVWLGLYFVLFMLAVVKYLLYDLADKKTKVREFIRTKIKTNLAALVFIGLVVILGVIFNLYIYAVWMIFLMELFHILFVGTIDKIYEKV